MLKIIPISALKDNYIWMIIHPETKSCVVVDPGEAAPVFSVLQYHGLELTEIWITHHHWDHTGGVKELVRNRANCRVFAPAKADVPETTDPLVGGEVINFFGVTFEVLAIPGHTLCHIAYYGYGAVFCGDTLFTGGCGRVFEGTMGQMYRSLLQLKNLPEETEIYCGHEYTEANLKFASLVEPDNSILQNRVKETQLLRANVLPTVPSLLKIEKQTNPFLRCEVDAVKQAAERYCGHVLNTEAEVFGVLREWKNNVG